jgi:hypothetical protein
MAGKVRHRAHFATPSLSPALPSVVLGHIVRGSAPDALSVDYPGNGRGPVAARTAVGLDAAVVARAVATKQAVLLVFENGDGRLPIVVGLVQEPAETAGAFLELIAKGRHAGKLGAPSADSIDARVDGERVVVEGKREVRLKCGSASITLRADGKVIVRGEYVETHAKGVNRIKGGAVKIN